MRKLVVVALAMLALPMASAGLSVASDQQITINFDGLPFSNAYLPADYFAPQGVIFSSLAGGPPHIRVFVKRKSTYLTTEKRPTWGVSVIENPYSHTYSPSSAIVQLWIMWRLRAT